MAYEREITPEPLPRPEAPIRPQEPPTFAPPSSGGSNAPVRRKQSILDLKTDLKSLKYNQFGVNPAVTKDINNPPNYNTFSDPASRRADDLVRVTKFLASANGVQFLAKQGTLSQIGLNRTGNTKQKLLQGLKNGAINTAKVAGSTLAQVPVAGTGTHFIRGFGGDSYLLTGGSNGKTGLRGFLNTVRNALGNADNVNGAKEVLAGRKVPANNSRDGANFRPSAYGVDLQKNTDERKDGINALEIQTKSILGGTDVPVDIIPFEISVIVPEKTDLTLGEENYLYFLAHLSSLSDNFAGNWNATNYIGRAEQMWTYDSFDRDISFGFKIAAYNKAELYPLYQKLNFLASSTAPTYSQESGFMRGTYSRITVGDYFYDIPGFFTNIGINWDVNYQWELGKDPGGAGNGLPIVPHILDVECTFKPIHNFTPETGASFLGTSGNIDRTVQQAQQTALSAVSGIFG